MRKEICELVQEEEVKLEFVAKLKRASANVDQDEGVVSQNISQDIIVRYSPKFDEFLSNPTSYAINLKRSKRNGIDVNSAFLEPEGKFIHISV